ncbi:MAG: CapA family protein [Clostridia bacterium]|nr:CapA family protein [Clostridia bacterium]
MGRKLKLVIGIAAAVGLLVLAALMLLIRFGIIDEEFLSSPSPNATPAPSDAVQTEPEHECFTISLVGDCTLAGNRFQSLCGDDMGYPFENVREYFENDDATIANLECNFSDALLSSGSLFHFKAPTENADMLVSGGIDFVTTANNHIMDYGQRGLDDTLSALDERGIAYGIDGQSVVFTTESGLKLGIYCGYGGFMISETQIKEAIGKLKADGAEYIICALHWGVEGAYRPNAYQKNLAHAAIDAGADLVYGSHPHVLQPAEEYGGGLILYSLGNFSFGGNSFPRDYDSVIVQLTLCRNADGGVSLEACDYIPCSMSGSDENNDFRPTPYKKGSKEFERTMSKLDGSFTGADLMVDYSFLDPDPSPEPSKRPELELPGSEELPIPSPDPEPSPIPVPEPVDPPVEE